MRFIAVILFSTIALASMPALASGTRNILDETSADISTCPALEGYPDCRPYEHAGTTPQQFEAWPRAARSFAMPMRTNARR
jgi:hypothetical protein